MKISIAMATYNGDKYIKEQLQSFIDQTRQPDELIITDDCSTDQTENIVCEFAKTAPFTVEFHKNQKNLGYCGNFNAALMKTTGNLVFLSDQDDVWFPTKIEHMLSVAERNPEALVVMNDATLTDEKLNEVGLTKVGQILSAGFSMESFVMGCCVGIKRELLDMCLPIPNGCKSHDNWLVGFADGLGAKVVEDIPLQYYRRHEANESQFIVNQTTKFSCIQVVLQTLKKAPQQNFSLIRKSHSEQMKLFATGVGKAILVAPERYKKDLQKLEKLSTERVLLAERRLSIAKKPLFSRLIMTGILYFRGDYKNALGLYSAVRDIVG